jgi:hypothetical protein
LHKAVIACMDGYNNSVTTKLQTEITEISDFRTNFLDPFIAVMKTGKQTKIQTFLNDKGGINAALQIRSSTNFETDYYFGESLAKVKTSLITTNYLS